MCLFLGLVLVLVQRLVGEVQGELVPAVGAGDFPDVQDALVDDDIRAAAGAGDLEEIVVVQGGAAAAAANPSPAGIVSTEENSPLTARSYTESEGIGPMTGAPRALSVSMAGIITFSSSSPVHVPSARIGLSDATAIGLLPSKYGDTRSESILISAEMRFSLVTASTALRSDLRWVSPNMFIFPASIMFIVHEAEAKRPRSSNRDCSLYPARSSPHQ